MPLFTVDQLTTPLTRQEVETSVYNVLGVLGVNTTSWKAGAVTRALVTGFSAVLAALSTLQAQIAKSGFLTLAEDDWKAVVAKQVYGVDKIMASFAPGQVTLINNAGGVYDFVAGDVTVANKRTGKIYKNTGSFHLGASSTVTTGFAATEAGSDSSADPGEVSVLVSPTMTGVSVTNTAAFVGTDDESDERLESRALEKLGSLSPNGPWDAYAFAARLATRADGSNIGVTRVGTLKDGYGGLTIFVATDSGAVSGTVGDLSTDLGVVDETLQRLATPLCVTLTTKSVTVAPVSVSYRAWLYNTSSLTPSQAQTLINNKLAAFFATQPVGGNMIAPGPGKVFADAILAIIKGVHPDIVHVILDSPAGDVALGAGTVATLIGSNGTFNFVAPPDGSR